MNGRTRSSVDSIGEQLGRLSENMERAREDRVDFKEQLSDMRRALQGLQQSSNTANGVLAELAKQNLGERVAQLENRYDKLSAALLTPEQCQFLISKVTGWNNWIGGGKTFVLKVLAGLLGSSAVMAVIIAGVLKLLGH